MIKKNLSMQRNGYISLEYLYQSKHLQLQILRTDFEKICEKYWKKITIYFKKILEEADLKIEEINEIILVVGSSRIKKKKKKKKTENIIKIYKNINPDEAVAMGALIVAFIETGYNILN